ncbi:ACT domain-containing protein [Longispora urticae]
MKTLSKDLIELAALFTAVAVAELFAGALGHGQGGPWILVGLAAALVGCSGAHRWWAHRHVRAPRTPAATGDTLWRIRTTVADSPGRLAALCTGLAELDVNILTIQVHPLGDKVIDEFLVVAPGAVTGPALVGMVTARGGMGTHVEPALAGLFEAPGVRESPAG